MDFDEMRKQLDEEPKKADAWRPEAGDELVGEIVGMNTRDGDGERDAYDIITVLEPDGSLSAFHAFHSVAKSLIAEQGPRAGDKIGVRYMGQETSKSSGREYHSYRMVLDRGGRSLVDDESVAATQAAKEADTAGTSDSIPFF
jgi:hypothetical protein